MPAGSLSPKTGQQVVRIIGGAWRSRRLKFPAAIGLRPTGDRIRETLFNWLGQQLYGQRCLDCFAGSGALGFEALSRGAAQVVMCESNRAVYSALQTNATLLGVNSTRLDLRFGDALQCARTLTPPFDVIFLDPPFQLPLLAPMLAACTRLLAPTGKVYVEHHQPLVIDPQWQVWREGRAGNVFFALLTQVAK